MKIGAQLFTLRDFCKTLDDFSETLKKVADIGYTTVQVSGTCEFDPLWLKNELDKNGLSCVLTHTKYDKMISDPIKVCRDHDIFDCKYIGLGMMPESGAKHGGFTEETYNKFVNEMLPVAKVFANNGHKLFYHNHQNEYAKDENGTVYLHKLCALLPPEQLGITLDTYWVQFGGADPAREIELLRGRVECIHLKDLAVVAGEQRMAAVGDGNINFDRIFRAAEDAGVEYMLVEQDNCNGEDPFECLRRSYNYLKSCGF